MFYFGYLNFFCRQNVYYILNKIFKFLFQGFLVSGEIKYDYYFSFIKNVFLFICFIKNYFVIYSFEFKDIKFSYVFICLVI